MSYKLFRKALDRRIAASKAPDSTKDPRICLNEDRVAKPAHFGGMHMWYVIQVRTGTEEKIRFQCEAKIPKKVLEHCFIPHYEERRKIQGTWRTLEKILFPGYVFLITENVEELFLQLKKIIGLTKLLGTGNEITALTESETAFLKRFGGEEQIVRMSEGIIEGSRTKILSGPLMGMEGQIRKIDRHKRKAWLEVEMFGRTQLVEIGLEITMKRI